MPRLCIVYATREGQTRRVADRIAATARDLGLDVDVVDAAALPPRFDVAEYEAALLAAPLHAGAHPREAETFAKANAAVLNARLSAFVSVSLSAAGDAKDRHDAGILAEAFLERSGWRATCVHLVAGAFRWSRYGFLTRQVMRFIAWRKGAASAPGVDIEYTDWGDLDAFVLAFLARLEIAPGR